MSPLLAPPPSVWLVRVGPSMPWTPLLSLGSAEAARRAGWTVVRYVRDPATAPGSDTP